MTVMEQIDVLDRNVQRKELEKQREVSFGVRLSDDDDVAGPGPAYLRPGSQPEFDPRG